MKKSREQLEKEEEEQNQKAQEANDTLDAKGMGLDSDIFMKLMSGEMDEAEQGKLSPILNN